MIIGIKIALAMNGLNALRIGVENPNAIGYVWLVSRKFIFFDVRDYHHELVSYGFW